MSPGATSSTLAGTCEPAHTKGLHLRWITTRSTAFRAAKPSPKGEDKIAKMRMWRRMEMLHTDQPDQVKMTVKNHTIKKTCIGMNLRGKLHLYFTETK